MEKQSLATSNPHLADPTAYRKALLQNVASSTAIETGQHVEDIVRQLAETTGQTVASSEQAP